MKMKHIIIFYYIYYDKIRHPHIHIFKLSNRAYRKHKKYLTTFWCGIIILQNKKKMLFMISLAFHFF